MRSIQRAFIYFMVFHFSNCSECVLYWPWNRTRGRTEKWYPLLVTMAPMFSKIPYTKCEVAIINFLRLHDLITIFNNIIDH